MIDLAPKVQRALAIVEREIRRFRRSPMSLLMSALFALVQLVVMGYAFGGEVKGVRLGLVDHDRGSAALEVRERASAVADGDRTFHLVQYAEADRAFEDLRAGRIAGVLVIPAGFSSRTAGGAHPRVALIADNADAFVAAALTASLDGVLDSSGRGPSAADRPARLATLDVVELYPHVSYIQYLFAGTIALSMVTMVMLGGGIVYVDEKARGVHEGYLVTPITSFELVAGFNVSGAIKAAVAGTIVTILGAPLAGVPGVFDPARFAAVLVVIVLTAFALMGLMFVLVARVQDPLMPRVIYGVLNTLLFFPSGAVYPTHAFPGWMQAMAAVNPFAYAVHALQNLLLRNTGLGAVAADLAFLAIFSAGALAVATLAFKRTL